MLILKYFRVPQEYQWILFVRTYGGVGVSFFETASRSNFRPTARLHAMSALLSLDRKVNSGAPVVDGAKTSAEHT